MKKQEFATFLNEQPTIILGRTGRELMFIAIGFALSYNIYGRLNKAILIMGLLGIVIKVLIAAIPLLLSTAVALIQVASRPLEEWCFILLLYLFLPKIHVYMPLEERVEEKDDDQEPSALFLKSVDDEGNDIDDL